MSLSPVESKRRAIAQRKRRLMLSQIREAFSDVAMLDHATLIVWTRGQMNGVRSTIKRLGLGCSA